MWPSYEFAKQIHELRDLRLNFLVPTASKHIVHAALTKAFVGLG